MVVRVLRLYYFRPPGGHHRPVRASGYQEIRLDLPRSQPVSAGVQAGCARDHPQGGPAPARLEHLGRQPGDDGAAAASGEFL